MYANTAQPLLRLIHGSGRAHTLSKPDLFYDVCSCVHSQAQPVRAKLEYMRLAKEHNDAHALGSLPAGSTGCIAIVDVICLGHVLHGAVEDTFEWADLIHNLHATAFRFSQVGVLFANVV